MPSRHSGQTQFSTFGYSLRSANAFFAGARIKRIKISSFNLAKKLTGVRLVCIFERVILMDRDLRTAFGAAVFLLLNWVFWIKAVYGFLTIYGIFWAADMAGSGIFATITLLVIMVIRGVNKESTQWEYRILELLAGRPKADA